MEPKDETKRVLKALDEVRRGHGWGRVGWLDRRLGNSPGYVARLLAGKPAMRLEQLFEILNLLEFEPGEFFAWVFGTRYRFQPERYLKVLARKKERTELLKQIDRIIDASVLLQATESESSNSEAELRELTTDLSRLEEFRFTDPTVARAESIDILKAVLNLTENSENSLQIICDALLLLGAIEIALRNYSPAAAYLARALRLAKKENYLQREARALQRCCYLLGTQGEYDIALNFVEQAMHKYIFLGDLPGIGKCLVDQGMMLRRANRPQQTIPCYEAALKYLPKEAWQYRVALHQSLGLAYIDLGEVDKAEQCAEVAAREHQTKHGLNWWKIFWLRGEVALRRDDLLYAETAFRKVLAASAAQENCIDVALITLRLSLVLLMAGRIDEMLELASDMVQQLETLKKESKIAAQAVNDFIKLALVGKVTEDFLDRAYKQMIKAVYE